MPTLLCVPIMVLDERQALADAVRAAELGADLVEFRLDGLWISGDAPKREAVAATARQMVQRCPRPSVLTSRAVAEGGHDPGPELERVAMLDALARGEPRPMAVDVELASLGALDAPLRAGAGEGRCRLVVSAHDFSGWPHDASRRLMAMVQSPACDVAKLAFQARSVRDAVSMLEMSRASPKPIVAIAMGEVGQLSRLLAPKFGGMLTFASLPPVERSRQRSATAPGQVDLVDMIGRYRFRSIGRATSVLGVVGWPVAHSLSPALHNAGFARAGIDAVYVPIPIPTTASAGDGSTEERDWLDFKASMVELVEHAELDLAGLSVTLPHKGRLVRLAKERGWTLDRIAHATGAGNTLVVHDRCAALRQGRLGREDSGVLVANTDAPAAVACVERAMGALPGRCACVIGSGGVARAVAWALADAGMRVLLAGRTQARVAALALELAEGGLDGAVEAVDPGQMAQHTVDLLVNATPVGMAGGPQPADVPVDLRTLGRSRPIVFDTVYAPRETPWLRSARSLGLATIDGLSMFVEQAQRQFELWTGTRIVRDVVQQTLGD